MINLSIVTEEKVVYDGEVDQLSVPGIEGQLTILPNHSSLVTLITAGELIVVTEGRTEYLAISSGILEVRPHSRVIILAERSEFGRDIDQKRAEAAYTRAATLLTEAKQENAEFAHFEGLVEKELNRLKVAGRYEAR